jgi:hypothetical protein
MRDIHRLLLPLVALPAALWGSCLQSVKEECGRPGLTCCAASRCDPGGECGPSGTCYACGGAEEPCCSTGCRAGFRCEQQTCVALVACGAVNEPCCAQGTCSFALRCEGASCIQPCKDGCAPGARRCSANGGVDVCVYDGPPCTVWTPLINRCPTGQECVNAECFERCPGACTLQSSLCTTEGLKVCVYDPATECPVYKVAPASPDNPVCMTGACDGPVCWESPLPQGNGLRTVTGWSADQLFLLDVNGNVIRRNGDSWGYDRRATTFAERFGAVNNCSLPTRSFAVGTGGRAWLRNSTGWQLEAVGDATADLRAVACDPSSRAVVAGQGGKAFARSDTGTWVTLPTGVTAHLKGVGYDSFSGRAWLVGNAGTIVMCNNIYDLPKTTCVVEAAGLTSQALNAAWAAPGGGQEVFAVGAQGTVLRRASNGTWSAVAQGVTGDELLGVFGLGSSSDVYGVGRNGAFLHRIGSDWFAESFTTLDLMSVYAVDDKNLFVVGSTGEIWFNDARGSQGPPPNERWRVLGGRAPTTEYLYGVGGLGAGELYAVGASGTVFHKSGDAWLREAQGLVSTPLYAVTQVSHDEVYAVGAGGVILARRNGVWVREGQGVTTLGLHGAWHDGSTVYAVGAAGAWLEKPVGAAGHLWVRVMQPATTQGLYAVGGTAAGEVFAAGAGCALLRKQSGTFTVQSPPGCSGQAFFALWVGADGELYVAGEGALVLHRAGGQWAREYVGTTLEPIHAIGRAGNDVWALADAGELYVRTAGTWRQEVANLTSRSLRAMYAAPDNSVVFVGAGGLIWQRR